MHLIVVSPPDLWPNEIHVVCRMFQMGLRYFHLRKPEFSRQDLLDYLEQIPSEYHRRIIIHYNFDLVRNYRLKGMHFNPGNVAMMSELQDLGGIRTFATQDLNQAISYRHKMDYIFLSPVYRNSVPGDASRLLRSAELKRLLSSNHCPRLVAMGGVKEEYIPELKELGFWGAAFLSEIWTSAHSPEYTLYKVHDMLKILY